MGGCIEFVPGVHHAFKCQDIHVESSGVVLLWDMLPRHRDNYLMQAWKEGTMFSNFSLLHVTWLTGAEALY